MFFEAPEPSPTLKRPRGRPRGSKAVVVRPGADGRALGVHHVAFLRSTLLGLDLRAAFERYLAFGETTTDLRHVEARRKQLLAQIVESGRRLTLARPDDTALARDVDLLKIDAAPAKAVTLPSLDEWVEAEGLDPDMWSEAELLAEYQAAFGLDNVEAIEAAEGAADLVKERVKALNRLAALLTVAPKADDKVDAWFARPVVLRLRNAGVVTLENLYQLVNVYGFRWYGKVKGFGARRAALVVAWLRAQSETVNLALRDGLDEPKSHRALRLGISSSQLVAQPRYGVVPLERLALPSSLLGLDGVFRSHLPNSLEAKDDLQAITGWLSRYDERPATQRSYRKEVERFALWMTSVQKKPVSSASALDCQAYRAFLAAVPAPWVNAAPVERTDPMWRPFRGDALPFFAEASLGDRADDVRRPAGCGVPRRQPDAGGDEGVRPALLPPKRDAIVYRGRVGACAAVHHGRASWAGAHAPDVLAGAAGDVGGAAGGARPGTVEKSEAGDAAGICRRRGCCR